ncbi:hypothetical protein J6590_075094 [Homalodisca vitripennis]|nr:hypothetical protein J6590_075094 [Homalodisca vitripennis]
MGNKYYKVSQCHPDCIPLGTTVNENIRHLSPRSLLPVRAIASPSPPTLGRRQCLKLSSPNKPGEENPIKRREAEARGIDLPPTTRVPTGWRVKGSGYTNPSVSCSWYEVQNIHPLSGHFQEGYLEYQHTLRYDFLIIQTSLTLNTQIQDADRRLCNDKTNSNDCIGAAMSLAPNSFRSSIPPFHVLAAVRIFYVTRAGTEYLTITKRLRSALLRTKIKYPSLNHDLAS